MPEPQRVISELFLDLFEVRELRRFLSSIDPDISSRLPGDAVSRSDVAWEAAGILIREGRHNGSFLDCLIRERAGRESDIRAAWSAIEQSLPSPVSYTHQGAVSVSTRQQDSAILTTPRPFRILSLDGGGILGLATAMFLSEMERHIGLRFGERFDMFCGTSTGSIIALGLASGMSADDITRMYEEMGPKVFWNPFPVVRFLRTYVRRWLMPMYNNYSLRKALTEQFGNRKLGDIWTERQKHILVPAFCLSTGQPRVFKTDHADTLTAHSGYKITDVALASAAAPTYLPAVEIKSPGSLVAEWFVDGGVFANDPALIAFAEALYYLGRKPDDIEILSISTPRQPTGTAHGITGWWSRHRLHRGLIGWAPSLADTFIESTSYIHGSILHNIARNPSIGIRRLERFRLENNHGLLLDMASSKAMNTLKCIGKAAAENNHARARVLSFFEE